MAASMQRTFECAGIFASAGDVSQSALDYVSYGGDVWASRIFITKVSAIQTYISSTPPLTNAFINKSSMLRLLTH